MSTILVAKRDGIGILTLNRPQRLNAISTGLCLDLHRSLVELNGDASLRAIILRGAGRAFCAGDDLKEFDQQSASQASARRHIEAIQQVTRDLMLADKIVVGAVHGYAVGGGFEWLLNCDMVVAASSLVAFFPEMALGQFVTGGVTHLLPRAVGYQRAIELLVLGERRSAADLLALGLVNRVVAEEALEDAAMAIARQVATKSAYSVGRLKRLLNRDLDPALERALAQETEITVACFGRGEAAERARGFGKFD